ncbi:MAG: phospho-N-acetylmuramoyl-pentapeptide-transferase [Alphaproteobacteria bacterium]|nr:phospho-N-acetylmuramoyl-pentapeptide-transferase [Alphaproteobacteria bacterium]
MFTGLLENLGYEFTGGALFAAGFAAAFLIMIVFGRWYINAMRRWQKKGQPISENVPQSHLAKAGTPTLGGGLIILAMIISSILFMDYHNPMPWIAIGALVWFGLIGFADDFKKVRSQGRKANNGLSKRSRLVLEGIGVIVLAYFINQTMPIYLPEYSLAFPGGYIFPLGILYFVLAYFVIAGTANAANITDGLDGMITKISIPTLLVMLAALYGATRIGFVPNAILLPTAGGLFPVVGAAIGALVGFLWFNSAPASIFMGDTGSLALGGFIGTVAMLLKVEIVMGVASLMMVAILASSFIQTFVYKLTKKNGVGKRIFKMAPLHHHFEMDGWPESKIVERFFIISVLFSSAALLLMRM